MRLLLDSDALCQLAIADVLDDAVDLLGTDLGSCGRLPALAHMLRRGGLRARLGPENCDRVIPVVEAMPVVGPPSEAWLDRLTPIEDIDPGEAQLFATAAGSGLTVVSGDKRALRALRNVPGFAGALEGRVVVLEALLVALCHRLGPPEMRRRTQPIARLNAVVGVCFSPGNTAPQAALLSYYAALAAELAPLVLWNPQAGGET